MDASTQKKDSSSSSNSKRNLLKTVQRDTKPVQAFINKFNNDWVMNFAGIMAYNLMMAILPIVIALIGITGLFLNGNKSVKQSILDQSKSIPGLENFVQLAITQINKDAGILLIIAILLAIFGGSRLFVTLEGIMDILYRVRPRTVIRQNLIAILMLVLFIILIPIMIIASAIPSFFSALLSNASLKTIPIVSNLTSGVGGLIIGGIVSTVVSLLIAFMLFETIYVVVPNQKVSWRNSWRGGITAAVLLEIFLVAFPFYVTHFLGGYAGNIGLVVILLVFFYYFAVILLLGAEVNAYFSEKVQPLPNDLVTFVSTMGGKLNRDIPSTESDAHTNTHPTDTADKAHISDELQQDEKIQKNNQHLQRQIISSAQVSDQARSTAKEKKKTVQGSSKLTTIVSVIAGTALTFVFQLVHLRHQGK